MAQVYFYVNAVLYAAFAVGCTLKSVPTSSGLGYVDLNKSGQSEYLVVYGGLQLGLACFYFLLGRAPQYDRLGILFSLLLYAPIVIYRVVTLVIYRPTSGITLGTAGLEVALLIWALVLWRTWSGLPASN